jgi:RNA polymerase sigma factor (sigma-70 family)
MPKIAAHDDEHDLLTRARAGDADAVGSLYAIHAAHARRFAISLSTKTDPDDVVAEAFIRVLRAMKTGGGPTDSFRPYLFTAVRRQVLDHSARAIREQPASDDEPWSRIADDRSLEEDTAQNELIQRVLKKMPPRWRVALWKTEVEGYKPSDLAEILGVSPNVASSLTFRAREGFRLAMLSEYVEEQPTASAACTQAREAIPAAVRGSLKARGRAELEEHLAGCLRCRMALRDAERVNQKFGAAVWPRVTGLLTYAGSTTGAFKTVGVAAAAIAEQTAGPTSGIRRISTRNQRLLLAAGAGVAVVAVAALALGPRGSDTKGPEPSPQDSGSSRVTPERTPASGPASPAAPPANAPTKAPRCAIKVTVPGAPSTCLPG